MLHRGARTEDPACHLQRELFIIYFVALKQKKARRLVECEMLQTAGEEIPGERESPDSLLLMLLQVQNQMKQFFVILSAAYIRGTTLRFAKMCVRLIKSTCDSH